MDSDRREERSQSDAHRRLEHLYEIAELFARFESVEETFDTALGIAARTLPIRSAILIVEEDGQAKMTAWPSASQDTDEMRLAKVHVQGAFSYLLGALAAERLSHSEKIGLTALPAQAPVVPGASSENRFIVIPLVVRRRAIFGVLQLEAATTFDEPDLMFVNTLANQLAIAVERDRAWRRDISRREDAEVSAAVSDNRRHSAEVLQKSYEALAAENARLYEQEQRAVQLREQILAIVSHDLLNPVGTIVLTLGLLERTQLPESERKLMTEGFSRIHRSAERMQRLIGDLLDFASIEAGRLAIKPQRRDPGVLVRDSLVLFEPMTKAKGLRLTAEVAAAMPQVDCDPDRIMQVLSNLVGNATKITGAGGRITLGLAVRGPEVVFSVEDTGPGISEGDLRQIFDRYWRSGEARYKGTGLGLAIAKGIIVAHGGRIWAESQLGHGAIFSFTLPVAA